MQYYKKKLMSKNGEVTMGLARELISNDVGDRIKTVEQYADNFGTGRGTIQSAIKFLRDEDAITLESRGHLGTFILSMDYKKLWDISDLGTIMGVMPLPYSRRYEGLATGLYKAFEMAAIPFNLAFMRGASKRIETLSFGKYDFVISSKLAPIYKQREYPSIEIIYEFGKNSYVGEHMLIYKGDEGCKIDNGMRIGIDPTSPDQFLLTKYECEGKNVKYVETSYNQITEKLENGEIDVAIWNEDEIIEKGLKYNMAKLKNPKSLEVNEKVSTAAMIVNKDHVEIQKIIKKFINMEIIKETQNQVIKGQLIPMY
jgi:hypothetical protein